MHIWKKDQGKFVLVPSFETFPVSQAQSQVESKLISSFDHLLSPREKTLSNTKLKTVRNRAAEVVQDSHLEMSFSQFIQQSTLHLKHCTR